MSEMEMTANINTLHHRTVSVSGHPGDVDRIVEMMQAVGSDIDLEWLKGLLPDSGKAKAETEDARVFGDDWVYCKSHVRPHPTGWCTVGASHKLGLGIPPGEYAERERQAYRKCRAFRLPLPIDGVRE